MSSTVIQALHKTITLGGLPRMLCLNFCMLTALILFTSHAFWLLIFIVPLYVFLQRLCSEDRYRLHTIIGRLVFKEIYYA